MFAGAELDRLAKLLNADLVAVDGDGALPHGLGVGEFELYRALAGGDHDHDAKEKGCRGPGGRQRKPPWTPGR